MTKGVLSPRGKRTMLDLILETLDVLLQTGPMRFSKISLQVQTSGDRQGAILAKLISKGLVNTTDTGLKSRFGIIVDYRITQTGREFANALRNLKDFGVKFT